VYEDLKINKLTEIKKLLNKISFTFAALIVVVIAGFLIRYSIILSE